MEHEDLRRLNALGCDGHLPTSQRTHHNSTKPVRHVRPLSPEFRRLPSFSGAHVVVSCV
jgi:hypothetical protein